MRRRFEDNAETRRFLFGVQRDLGTKKFKLPAHSMTVLLCVSAQAEERAAYSDVLAACSLTASQMAHAVDALIGTELLARNHEDADARRTHLVLTKKGRSVVGALIIGAQPCE
jgi:DNA-binding MarR family transcriptional regulator